MRSGDGPKARIGLNLGSGFGRALSVCALVCLCASSSGAQVASQRRIPLKKEPGRRVDTVWVHDTVTVTRIDTVRLAPPSLLETPLPPRIDTLMRVDTTKDCRDLFFPIPIPIPLGRTGHNDPALPLAPGASVNVTPEPTTIVMVGAGLVAVGLIARRKKSKKEPPV